MRYIIALTVVLFSICSARADTVYVDLNSIMPAVADAIAPCYCGMEGGPIYVYNASPGTTVDFGSVELFWHSAFSPGVDSGPVDYLLFPVAFIYFNIPTALNFGPSDFSCALSSAAACGLNPLVESLVFTIPPGSDGVEFGWYGGTYFT